MKRVKQETEGTNSSKSKKYKKPKRKFEAAGGDGVAWVMLTRPAGRAIMDGVFSR